MRVAADDLASAECDDLAVADRDPGVAAIADARHSVRFVRLALVVRLSGVGRPGTAVIR
jgi:hypothetical protein